MKPYFHDADAGITIYHADCRDVLPELAHSAAALILTDPPYGISVVGGDIYRPGGSRLRQEFFAGDDDTATMNALVAEACRMTLPLMRPDGAAYWWCGHRQFGMIESILAATGRKTGFLVWRKTNAPPSVRKASWRYVSELCVWVGKPKHFLGQAEMRNVIDVPIMANGAPGKTAHPTQKPLDLFKRIILAATDPGDLVIDPFLGSGTTARACTDLGRRCIGIEREEGYCEIAAGRLMQRAFPLAA